LGHKSDNLFRLRASLTHLWCTSRNVYNLVAIVESCFLGAELAVSQTYVAAAAAASATNAYDFVAPVLVSTDVFRFEISISFRVAVANNVVCCNDSRTV